MRDCLEVGEHGDDDPGLALELGGPAGALDPSPAGPEGAGGVAWHNVGASGVIVSSTQNFEQRAVYDCGISGW